jgi:hypothetical protein
MLDFIYRNISISEADKNQLKLRVTKVIDSYQNPFTYKEEYDAWFIDNTPYPKMEQGGYLSENQARIALTLHLTKPKMNYQELYKMSKFIIQGLQD